MSTFACAIFRPDGKLLDNRQHDYGSLCKQPAFKRAIRMFASLFRQYPMEFQKSIVLHPSQQEELSVEWTTPVPSTGRAILRLRGDLAMACVVLTGTEPIVDQATVDTTQEMLGALLQDPKALRDDLKRIENRPLLAMYIFDNFGEELDAALGIAARSLAAAFFNYRLWHLKAEEPKSG